MTQKQKVLNHLIKMGSISTMEAFRDYGITRLAARIQDLLHDGYPIYSEMHQHPITKVRFARYFLERHPT